MGFRTGLELSLALARGLSKYGMWGENFTEPQFTHAL